MSSNLSLILLFIFLSLVKAQYLTEPPGTAAQPTSSATIPSICGPSRTHTVSVGNRGSNFDPNVTFANPGDVVVFEFFPINHSVIRTDFVGNNAQQNPCVPYELLHPGSTSQFSSGNKLVESDPNPNGSDATTWNLTIEDRQPVWFYCDAPGSCHPNGMVGVINPNSSNTVQRQFSAALTAPYQLSPGQSWPPGTQFGSSGIKGSNSKLAPGAIAGIVIGGLFFVVIAALSYFVGRSRTYHQIMRARRRHQEALPPINANGSTMDLQNILNTSSGYGQKGAWSGGEGVELHQRPGPMELYV